MNNNNNNNNNDITYTLFPIFSLYLPLPSLSLLLSDGVPSDGTPIRIVSTFHLSLVVIFYTISFAGLVFCIVCLVFTFYFRNKK